MTIIDLYRSITKDQSTHYRTIQAAIGRQSKKRQRILTMYSKGFSDRQCGAKLHLTHGACRGLLMRTCWAIHKAVNQLPRYHLVGRKHAGRPAAEPAEIETAAAGRPSSFRDFLSSDERKAFVH
jgi:hypothetical protein